MSVLVICVSFLILFDSMYNVKSLEKISSGEIFFTKNSSIAFILISISLLLQQLTFPKINYTYLTIAKLIGIAIILFGLNLFIENISTSIVAINFILIGIALILLSIKYFEIINQLLYIVIGLSGIFILSNYLFNNHTQFLFPSISYASLHVAFCFVLISLTFFFIYPSLGIMSLFISNTTGGSVARYLIPIVIITPTLLGYLRILSESRDAYSPLIGMELYSISITIVFLIVTILISFMLNNIDINRLKTEDELRVSEDRFHKAMDTAPIGMAIISLDGKFVEVNKALCDLVGYPKNELIKLTFQQITHPDDLAIDVANSQKLIDGKINLNQIEKRYIRKNGDIIWVQLTASVLRNSNTNKPLYFIAQVEDITERKHNEERIRYLAYHDSLTNLPNRRLLLDRLVVAIDFAKRHHIILALLFLDLDKFKDVNDTLGHDVGDELLKAAAVRLNASLRSVDTISRISGDEFVIILNGIQSPDEAGHIANKIIGNMSNRFLIGGHELYIGCTIGISIYPKDGIEISDLMKKADLAMYTAKAAGGNQYHYYVE